jgi:2-polyprenyl-3-methyl-5-hydroxy-6-metoxy-1,4-benzoquinol methylase
LSHFLIRLGRFIQSLPIALMRPDDLVEFSRQTYVKPTDVESWAGKDLVNSGLTREEAALLNNVTRKDGRLLLLGVGGGREAIPLARMGFQVTGVDFVPEMVQKAGENAEKRGIRLEGLVQEISKLDVPADSYDIVLLSAAMYSSVPTRDRRVHMLKRIWKALRPEGFFVCQFHWDTKGGASPKVEFARKAIAFITLGNLWYEKGDMLWGGAEFIHGFSSEDELRREFQEGGFEVNYIHLPEGIWGGAVLRKPTPTA